MWLVNDSVGQLSKNQFAGTISFLAHFNAFIPLALTQENSDARLELATHTTEDRNAG
jgi:hypothetical protein